MFVVSEEDYLELQLDNKWITVDYPDYRITRVLTRVTSGLHLDYLGLQVICLGLQVDYLKL